MKAESFGLRQVNRGVNDVFIEYVKTGKYSEAYSVFKDKSSDSLYNFLINLGFDTQVLGLYTFANFLLIERESAELHYCAAILIAQVFCYIEGAYSMGLFHARRCVELCEDDPSYKEYLLSYFYIPEKLLTFKEALDIAQRLVIQDPQNQAAKQFFLDIENKNISTD